MRSSVLETLEYFATNAGQTLQLFPIDYVQDFRTVVAGLSMTLSRFGFLMGLETVTGGLGFVTITSVVVVEAQIPSVHDVDVDKVVVKPVVDVGSSVVVKMGVVVVVVLILVVLCLFF